MAEIRYYTDEQVSRAVINGLRQRGVDVLSVPEANRIGASDDEQLAFALAQRARIADLRCRLPGFARRMERPCGYRLRLSVHSSWRNYPWFDTDLSCA